MRVWVCLTGAHTLLTACCHPLAALRRAARCMCATTPRRSCRCGCCCQLACVITCSSSMPAPVCCRALFAHALPCVHMAATNSTAHAQHTTTRGQVLYALLLALDAEGWTMAGPQFEELTTQLRMSLADVATRCAQRAAVYCGSLLWQLTVARRRVHARKRQAHAWLLRSHGTSSLTRMHALPRPAGSASSAARARR